MPNSSFPAGDEEHSVSRRDFFKLVGIFGSGALLTKLPVAPNASSPVSGSPYYCLVPNTLAAAHPNHHAILTRASSVAERLEKFVDRLPIPPLIRPHHLHKGVPVYRVSMKQVMQKLHRDLPPTLVWGYNGIYPGPTFDVRRDNPIKVRWTSDLPTTHFLPLDHTLHGAEAKYPDVRNVVHLHGAQVLPEHDGYPEAWFTPHFGQVGPAFKTRVYEYPNSQRAAQLWYHDHALGITRLNVYAGLAGMYFIRDQEEDALHLPSGAYEIPLLIQDRLFNEDGSLFYPVQAPGDPDAPPVWVPELFGDTVLVNGKVWPYCEVEPRMYRLRILNGSNARFYNLGLKVRKPATDELSNFGPQFYIIGTDGGLMSKPVTPQTVFVAPAERYDVLVDFSEFAGQELRMYNDAPGPFPGGGNYIPRAVMSFRVKAAPRSGFTVPKYLSNIPILHAEQAVRTRTLTLRETASPLDNPIKGLISAHWDEPVTETPKAGKIEIWQILNLTDDAHPIHIHLVQFQVLDRSPFDCTLAPENIVFTGPPRAPEAQELGAWKDTVLAFPCEITQVIARFDLPPTADKTPGARFRYVTHCHILEHEDNEMMRPYDVVNP